MSKNILVTGGNFGIGLALCKLLVKDHDCYVYLGCQDPTSGNNALMKIFQEVPDTYNIIQVIQIDVGDEQSCAAAAKTLEVIVEKVHLLKYGFHNKSFILNAPLVSCPIPVIRSGWVQQQTHPKRMTGIGQLTRGAFRINDLL